MGRKGAEHRRSGQVNDTPHGEHHAGARIANEKEQETVHDQLKRLLRHSDALRAIAVAAVASVPVSSTFTDQLRIAARMNRSRLAILPGLVRYVGIIGVADPQMPLFSGEAETGSDSDPGQRQPHLATPQPVGDTRRALRVQCRF